MTEKSCDKIPMPRSRRVNHDTRHKDVIWRLPEGRVGRLGPEVATVALLMDLRDEVKQGNTLLRAILAALKK